jgi:hypothetical protein
MWAPCLFGILTWVALLALACGLVSESKHDSSLCKVSWTTQAISWVNCMAYIGRALALIRSCITEVHFLAHLWFPVEYLVDVANWVKNTALHSLEMLQAFLDPVRIHKISTHCLLLRLQAHPRLIVHQLAAFLIIKLLLNGTMWAKLRTILVVVMLRFHTSYVWLWRCVCLQAAQINSRIGLWVIGDSSTLNSTFKLLISHKLYSYIHTWISRFS